MPTTVTERTAGRRLNDDTAERSYIIRGTDDEATARTDLITEAPSTIGAKILTDAEVDEIDDSVWIGTVRYTEPGATTERLEVNDTRRSFSVSGQTVNIKQSIDTISRTVAIGDAPDFKGAINADGERVEGTEIIVPNYTYSVNKVIAAASIDNSYKAILNNLVGKVNDESFEGTAAGESLLLEVTGTERDDGSYDMQFSFAGNPNATSISVGGSITVAAKKGWEYLWILYERIVDVDAKALVQQPKAAYVEKVYEVGDFSDLGI